MAGKTCFPYYYGDSPETHQWKSPITSKRALQVASLALSLAFMSSPVSALEPAVAVRETREVTQASMALTCAVCGTAGWVCRRAAETTVKQNPKFAAALGCAALISWCAAKASPL